MQKARGQEQLLPFCYLKPKVSLKDSVSGEEREEQQQQRPRRPPTGLAAATTSISPLADRPLSHVLRITLTHLGIKPKSQK